MPFEIYYLPHLASVLPLPAVLLLLLLLLPPPHHQQWQICYPLHLSSVLPSVMPGNCESTHHHASPQDEAAGEQQGAGWPWWGCCACDCGRGVRATAFPAVQAAMGAALSQASARSPV